MRSLVVLFLSVSAMAFAAEENCRLITQVKYTNGKKVVEVTERFSPSYEDCKLAAKQREIDSEFNDKIESTKVIFAYRAPSILYNEE